MKEPYFKYNLQYFPYVSISAVIVYMLLPKILAVFLCSLFVCFITFAYRYSAKYENIQYYTKYFSEDFLQKTAEANQKLVELSWITLGILIPCLIFSKHIAIFSWLLLFLSNYVKYVDKNEFTIHYIDGDKSYEGMIVYLLFSIFFGMLFYINIAKEFTFISIVIGSIAASSIYSFSDLIALKTGFKVSNSFSIPFISGLALSLS